MDSISTLTHSPVIDMCLAYGFSNNTVNALSCRSKFKERTITCLPGFSTGIGGWNPSITLQGPSPFLGCFDIDECSVYGFSNHSSDITSCVQGINNRTITCALGFYATSPSTPSITLIGSSEFVGCKNMDECMLYRFSGRGEFTQNCTDGLNSRTITCLQGAVILPVSPTSPRQIALQGNSTFPGCGSEILLFSSSLLPSHLLSGMWGRHCSWTRGL